MEQLWYGWAERGQQGYNRQQIISASPGLMDSSSRLTRIALSQCQRPIKATFGWCDIKGIRLVFRRTPTGLDDRERPGNFFVHIVAGRLDEINPTSLSRIASTLLCSLPDDVPESLPRLDHHSPEFAGDFRSSEDLHSRALAFYLENLSRGQLTAFQTTPDMGSSLACHVASHMPASLGLVGFSAHEGNAQDRSFDVLACAVHSPLFHSTDPSSDPSQRARLGAALLTDAARGVSSAQRCVQELVSISKSRRDFSNFLLAWIDIEQADEHTLDSEKFRWLAGNRVFRDRLSALAMLGHIVTLAIKGNMDAGALLDTLLSDGQTRHLEIIKDRISAVNGPADILVSLSGARASESVRVSITEIVGEGVVQYLVGASSRQRVELLQLFMPPRDAPGDVIFWLADRNLFAEIVENPKYPLHWKLRIVKYHSDTLAEEILADFIYRNPMVVREILEGVPGNVLLGKMEKALQCLDPAVSLRLIVSISGVVPASTELRWWNNCAARLSPMNFFAAVRDRAIRHGDLDDAVVVSAFVNARASASDLGVDPPDISALSEAFNDRMSGASRNAWRYVVRCFVLLDLEGELPEMHTRSVVESALLLEADVRSIVWECVASRIVSAQSSAGFMRGVRILCESLHRDLVAHTLLRILALNSSARSLDRFLHWVILSEDYDTAESNPGSLLRSVDLRLVRRIAVAVGHETSRDLRAQCRSKATRRWLAEVSPVKRGIWGRK